MDLKCLLFRDDPLESKLLIDVDLIESLLASRGLDESWISVGSVYLYRTSGVIASNALPDIKTAIHLFEYEGIVADLNG